MNTIEAITEEIRHLTEERAGLLPRLGVALLDDAALAERLEGQLASLDDELGRAQAALRAAQVAQERAAARAEATRLAVEQEMKRRRLAQAEIDQHLDFHLDLLALADVIEKQDALAAALAARARATDGDRRQARGMELLRAGKQITSGLAEGERDVTIIRQQAERHKQLAAHQAGNVNLRPVSREAEAKAAGQAEQEAERIAHDHRRRAVMARGDADRLAQEAATARVAVGNGRGDRQHLEDLERRHAAAAAKAAELAEVAS